MERIWNRFQEEPCSKKKAHLGKSPHFQLSQWPPPTQDEKEKKKKSQVSQRGKAWKKGGMAASQISHPSNVFAN